MYARFFNRRLVQVRRTCTSHAESVRCRPLVARLDGLRTTVELLRRRHAAYLSGTRGK